MSISMGLVWRPSDMISIVIQDAPLLPDSFEQRLMAYGTLFLVLYLEGLFEDQQTPTTFPVKVLRHDGVKLLACGKIRNRYYDVHNLNIARA